MSVAGSSVATKLRHGLRTSIRANFAAFGFSVMVTASFGITVVGLGSPSTGEIFLFVAGAVGSFTAIEAVASGGFRHGLRGEPTDVVALGTAFSLVSTGLGVGAAALVVESLNTRLAWLGAAAAATCVYVLATAVEMALADHLKERSDSAS